MRYLRMLSNSLAAAALATGYVLVLLLQLNPGLPLNPLRLAPIAGAVGLFYSVHLAVLFYVVLVLGQMLARELFSPAWLSVRVLAWLGAVAAAGGAALMWANVHTFAIVLEASTIEHMTTGAVVLAASSALFVIIALARGRAGPGRSVLALPLLVVAAGSIAGPMALRGRGRLPPLESHPLGVALDTPAGERGAAGRSGGMAPPRHVTLLAVDAGSLALVTNAAAEGRLPNFGRMLDAGAVMHLATLHPTSAEAVWAAVATGKLPQKNGVRSAGVYRLPAGGDPIQLLPEYCYASGLVRLGFLVEEPYTAATLRVRTLWSILSTLGIPVGVVNWPLTYPAPVVRGYLVSDEYSRVALTPAGIDDPAMLYPPELHGQVSAIVQSAGAAGGDGDDVPEMLDARQAGPARTDRINDRLGQSLTDDRAPQVTVTRYQSLDAIGHYFLRYAMPDEFGDVSADEQRRLGSVLERHYALIDAAIGRAIARLGPDDLLLVVSGYGMEPLGIGKRLLERLVGDADISGTHEAAPDGFLMAYGAPVANARALRRASVVDVVPTVLYFLGLPIGRDMDGFARTDLFAPAFTAERPLTFIPTYAGEGLML